MLRQSVGHLAKLVGRRALSTSEAAGVKVSSIDDGRAVSEVTLLVSAGSRYETTPGVAHVLKSFAFRDTQLRSGLRLIRESELLGGGFQTKLGREHLALTAKFLRGDLPYFVEALASVAKSSRYTQHELDEEVLPLVKLEAQRARSSNSSRAVEAAYEVAFREGLGNAVVADSYSPVTLNDVVGYSNAAYNAANIRVLGRGVLHNDLVQFVGNALDGLPIGKVFEAPKATFHAGEARVKSASPEQAVVIAFPTEKSASLQALQFALDSRHVKWSTGVGALNEIAARNGVSIRAKYNEFSDAAMFYVLLSGSVPEAVSAAATEVSAAIKKVASSGVSSEIAKRAVAQAKFQAAQNCVDVVSKPTADVSKVNATSLKETAGKLVNGKVALAAVGKTHLLPHVDDLF